MDAYIRLSVHTVHWWPIHYMDWHRRKANELNQKQKTITTIKDQFVKCGYEKTLIENEIDKSEIEKIRLKCSSCGTK